MSAYPTDNTASTIPDAANNTGGTYAESQFLSIVIPEIEASSAFQQNGLIVVTYDEAYPPFTYSGDSQANSQLQNADAQGSLANDAAGETLYGRSINWEPTGPNATVVTSPTGQVLTAGPGDSAYLDRPTAATGSLLACTEPASVGTQSGTDNWVPFVAPTGTNNQCIPGFQANTEQAAPVTTPSLTIASGSSTVPYLTAGLQNEGEAVTFNATAPTLQDAADPSYSGSAYVGNASDTATQPSSSSSPAFTGQFTLVDSQGNPLTVASAYTGTLTLTGTAATDPFYDAFDATLGGGDSGAVAISPYITPGTVSNTYYNHYSLLRTIEDIFGTTGGVDGSGHLGFAAQPGLAPFGGDVFTNATTQQTQTVTATQTVTTPATTVTTPGSTVTTPGGTNTVTVPGQTRTVTKVKSVVPYLTGDTLAQAKSALAADKLKLGKVKGSGVVASVSPRAGTEVSTGTKVLLTLKKK